MSTADTSKKLTLGIVGCGRIVDEAHALALLSLSDRARIAAVADPSAERRQSVLNLIGEDGVAEFGDWNRMLEAGGLDAVVIAVPDHLHARAIAGSSPSQPRLSSNSASPLRLAAAVAQHRRIQQVDAGSLVRRRGETRCDLRQNRPVAFADAGRQNCG